ncbi:hypothetical protein [Hyphococcus sp.]|uniref:hypothetical protein n=1 Tax=Hyphococcus sp. TaxID=2038636 RepID=UPI0035C726E8
MSQAGGRAPPISAPVRARRRRRWSGFSINLSFARDYARDNCGDDYFAAVKAALTGFGPNVALIAPIIGALAAKIK